MGWPKSFALLYMAGIAACDVPAAQSTHEALVASRQVRGKVDRATGRRPRWPHPCTTRDMRREIFWETRNPRRERYPRIVGRVACDFAVIGGGISGLSTAQHLIEARPDAKIVVLEAEQCGGGATGKSSGFITPDSALQVVDLIRRFGEQAARELWLTAMAACGRIRHNVEAGATDCDFLEADSLFVAARPSDSHIAVDEHDARCRLGLPSMFIPSDAIHGVLDADGYGAAVRYPGTFGIDALAYIRGLADRLRKAGVTIFESSKVLAIDDHRAITPTAPSRPVPLSSRSIASRQTSTSHVSTPFPRRPRS